MSETLGSVWIDQYKWYLNGEAEESETPYWFRLYVEIIPRTAEDTNNGSKVEILEALDFVKQFS